MVCVIGFYVFMVAFTWIFPFWTLGTRLSWEQMNAIFPESIEQFPKESRKAVSAVAHLLTAVLWPKNLFDAVVK